MDIFLFAHGVGFFALCLSLLGLWQQDKQRLMLVSSVASVFYALHFVLIGSNISAAICILITIRILYASRFPKSHLGFIGFTGMGVALTYYQYGSIVDLLPLSAFISANTAYFYLYKLPMRTCFIAANLALMLNAYCIGSYSSLIAEGVALLLNVRGAVRVLHARTEGNQSISTGLKVRSGKDNAAYFSIAKTISGDAHQFRLTLRNTLKNLEAAYNSGTFI